MSSQRGDESGFANALRNGDRRRLLAFPKADRHCHSLFGASLSSISAWAGTTVKEPPARMASLDEMREYAHSELYVLIRNREGFEFTAERAIVEAIEDGVSILEMSFDADFLRFYRRGAVEFIDFIKALVSRYSNEIDARPEIGISKNRDPWPQVKRARVS